MSNSITLYTQPNCPYCDRAKIWFERNCIEYTAVDVTKDDEARKFIKEVKGHRTVPQIYFHGELLVEGGYTGLSKQNPETIREILREKQAA